MSSTSEVWISIAVTDRPASLRRLAGDLVELAKEFPCALSVLVIDNSKTAAARRSTEDALAVLRSVASSVRVEQATIPGGSIARSRRDQRNQVGRARASASPPAFIWMLDDDVRLEHQVVEGGTRRTRRLHNHLGFLLDVKAKHPELEVLLGEVSGDPPIPAVATFASRLEDFAVSLRRMGGMAPHALWEGEPAGASGSSGDDYYDFSEGATEARLWTASRRGLKVAEALEEMLCDACDIPFGIAFSRPILANALEFGRLRNETIRGAHAVFFSSEAFLSQRYASLTIEGIETRRSDTLASTLFARACPERLRKSGFAVLHSRPRHESALPTSEELARNLIADTWGAALTRALGDDGRTVMSFLQQRLDRIDGALSRTAVAIGDARRLAAAIAPWAKGPRALWQRVDERLQWVLDTVPGVCEGRLAAPWRDVLASIDGAKALEAFARRLAESPDAE